MAFGTAEPPNISFTLAVEPSSFVLDHANPPTLSVTVISHADKPITIFTWPSLLNLSLGQERSNFECIDLTTDRPLRFATTGGPRRGPFSRIKGSRDDSYFHTLQPGKPVTLKHTFLLARQCILTEGHRYRYAIRENNQILYWWYGSRGDILRRYGSTALPPSSGSPIKVETAAAVEFEVIEQEKESLVKETLQQPAEDRPWRSRCTSGVM